MSGIKYKLAELQTEMNKLKNDLKILEREAKKPTTTPVKFQPPVDLNDMKTVRRDLRILAIGTPVALINIETKKRRCLFFYCSYGFSYISYI